MAEFPNAAPAADDILAPLLDLADVRPALDAARAEVDTALRHPALRRSGGGLSGSTLIGGPGGQERAGGGAGPAAQVAAEVGLRSAVAAAALAGHAYEVDEVRAGTVTDPVLQGALRVAQEVHGLAELWLKVPRQVLARIHVLAGRNVVAPGELGRPVSVDVVPRLSGLLNLVAGGSTVPTLLLASVVHGELLSLRPFPGPAEVVACAAARVTLVAGGLDPRALLAVEVGHLARQPEYVGAAGAFATGKRDGIRSWIKHYTAAVSVAAGELTALADAASPTA